MEDLEVDSGPTLSAGAGVAALDEHAAGPHLPLDIGVGVVFRVRARTRSLLHRRGFEGIKRRRIEA